MGKSDSYDYNVTGLNIITEAMELIGALSAGGTINANDSASCLRTLEMMVKNYQAQGIGLWKNVEAALFLEYGEELYSVGSTGDNVTSSWVKTEIATAADAADLTITVDDDTGISDTDVIGIELDDGTLQWTTVNGVPAANVVTLTDALTDSSAVGNHVYAYSAKLVRPVDIANVRIHNADDTERTIRIKSRQEYMNLPNKEDTGTTNLVYYDPQLDNGYLYIWPACGDVKEYLKFTARIPIMDFDSTANDADFGQEWFLPLAWNLAVLIAPKFGREMSTKFETKAGWLLQSTSDFDREENSIFLQVG